MKIKSTFTYFNTTFTINALILERKSSDEYMLDKETFYKKHGHKIPVGKGYEIEIVNNHEILEWHTKNAVFLNDKRELARLHVHIGNDGKPYVCYPLQIDSESAAIRLFKEWARVMFVQIFFGLSDDVLYLETQSGETTTWANFIDQYFIEIKNGKPRVED